MGEEIGTEQRGGFPLCQAIVVPWPLGKPGGTLFSDLSGEERQAYIAYKQEREEQRLVNAALAALAAYLTASEEALREERGLDPYPPQLGTPSRHVVFERPMSEWKRRVANRLKRKS